MITPVTEMTKIELEDVGILEKGPPPFIAA